VKNRTRWMLILTLAASSGAPAAAMLAMEGDAAFAGGDAVDPDYTAGQAALDAARWAEAAARFAATAAKHGAEADAATYWQAYAENVAYGQGNPSSAITSWMGSSGHRANIMNPSLTEIGTAVANGPDGRPYWVQVFGTPR